MNNFGFTIYQAQEALRALSLCSFYDTIDVPVNWTRKEQKELEDYIEPLRLI